jgi:hypothetical protein
MDVADAAFVSITASKTVPVTPLSLAPWGVQGLDLADDLWDG